MRERFFLKLIKYLERHPSKLVKRLQIQMLLNMTARAFGKRARCVLFFGDPLREYAAFTKECLQGPCDRKRLFFSAYDLGLKVRKTVGFSRAEDREHLVFLLYKNIGIDMKGSIPGTIRVSSCYFSQVYSEEECKAISALDHGIMAGICGKGKLRFTERLTGGCDHCIACFTKGCRRTHS